MGSCLRDFHQMISVAGSAYFHLFSMGGENMPVPPGKTLGMADTQDLLRRRRPLLALVSAHASLPAH